jgi:hypothetical protein
VIGKEGKRRYEEREMNIPPRETTSTKEVERMITLHSHSIT